MLHGVLFLPGVPLSDEDKQSHSLPNRPSVSGTRLKLAMAGSGVDDADIAGLRPLRVRAQQPNVIACLAAVVCIVSLFLPTEGDSSSKKPFFEENPWLCLTVNQKLVFAYVLGLVTMAILRTT